MVTKTMIYAIAARLSLELLWQHRAGRASAAVLRHRRLAAVLLRPKWTLASALGCCRPGVPPRRCYALAVGALSPVHARRVLHHHGDAGLRPDGPLRRHDTPLGGGTDGIYLSQPPQTGGLDLGRPHASTA